MSHHGNEDEMLRRMREDMNRLMKDSFGEYPDGKLNDGDSGAIAMAVVVEQGRVVLRFPKPVAWAGFTADEAIALAESLVQNARKAGSKKPLTFTFGT